MRRRRESDATKRELLLKLRSPDLRILSMPPVSHAPPPIHTEEDLAQFQFNLIDEDRDNLLFYKCPVCCNRVTLKRKWSATGPRFAVQCWTPSCPHPYDTRWHKSSRDAVQCYRLAVKLAGEAQ